MHEINEQWLKNSGFFWEMRHPRFHIIVWTDKTHRIEFRQGCANRKYCKYTVHIDNSDMQSIGSADLIYVEEFVKFLECLGEFELANDYRIE